jgi:hypothetical protein
MNRTTPGPENAKVAEDACINKGHKKTPVRRELFKNFY